MKCLPLRVTSPRRRSADHRSHYAYICDVNYTIQYKDDRISWITEEYYKNLSRTRMPVVVQETVQKKQNIVYNKFGVLG
jgi:hypothetical protein